MDLTKEQSRAVYESGTNIIVSAGAGSGKTTVLTKRVIEKIKSGTHINELLILTFTKAAAAEMKNRIRENLSDYREELNLLNSSYITTFDSYALSILKKYHYLLNISKNIEITDESLLCVEKNRIFNEIFDSLYLENNENFNELINKYCVKKDSKLRNNIMEISNQIESMFNKEEFISYIKNNYFESDNINNIINDYKELLESKRNYIKNELNNLSYYLNSRYIEQVNQSLYNLLNINIEDLYLIEKIDFPTLRGASEDEKELNNEFKDRVKELISYSKYGSFTDIKNNILSSKKDINTILYIVEKYLDKLNSYKKKNNIYTFNDVALLSIKILNDNEFIRNEVRDSFKEIMIDEYQDTNDVQEKFISLISNNNVYMVGDIKQSIYRFRGSNPSLFKLKYDLYSKNNEGIKIDLLENFRSRSEIVDGINKIFSLIMDNDIGGAEYKVSHEMKFGNKDYLSNFYKTDYNIDILEYESDPSKEISNDEIEIFTIAKDIKNKVYNKYQIYDNKLKSMRDVRYSDFSIILDRSNTFSTYKKIFEHEGIPLTILRDDNITNNVEVELIKNLIDIVIRINNDDFNNEFKFDFMSIGRSFLYEYNDEYLFEIMTSNGFKETSIYKDISSIKITNTKTCKDIFDEILEVTDVYNKIYKVGNYKEFNARINKMQELSILYSDLGYDIYEFNDELSDILTSDISIKCSNQVSDSDSVKILTIHGSKGLEYPICYFADLNHEFNRRDLKNKIIVDNKYGIIIPNDDNESSLIKELYKNVYNKEDISERLRLFYVALTRAKEKIIIVLPYKETIKLNKDEYGVIDINKRLRFKGLSDFIYSIKDYCNEFFKKINLKDLNLTKDYLNTKSKLSEIKLYEDDIYVEEINIVNDKIDNKHFSKETYRFIDKDIQNKMDFGNKVHETLEYIDFKNFNPNLIEDEFIRNKITKFMSNELLKNIKDAKIYKEFEFNYQSKDTLYNGVIDLMLEYNDHIDIVDYKLKNIDDEAYFNQLNGYKSYIESISNKKVNTYLYSIINEDLKEIK